MEKVRLLLEEKGTEVVAVSPETPVFDLVRTMSERHIGAVLVLDGKRPVGIVSERDIMTRVLLQGSDPRSVTAGEVMSRDLVVVSPSTPIRETMAVMTQQRCRHLPVMEGGNLVGVVSIGDCTRWVSRSQEFTIHHMKDYIADKYPR